MCPLKLPHAVLEALLPHIEAVEIDDGQAPVRACYQYLRNRLKQLDYASAQANGLPIDSGEIKSAHRNIVQERLKLPGAWWKKEHARNMLSLRVVRVNGDWDDY